MTAEQLKGKIVSGVFWNIVQLAINRSFAFLIKILLAKLLFPEQFGLVGMAMVFTSFVQVFNDLGIGAALVQRKEEHLREAHFHTAFWTGVAWSALIYLILSLIVAPLAASFYKQPILTKLIPVLSIGVLSSPIILVHNAQLTKQMNFKRIAVINNLSSIFSGILALCLAFVGAGVWALVFNSVASFLIAMPLYFRSTGWKPKLIWEKQAFKDVFGFGVYTTGTNFFNTLINQLDYLLVGKFLGAAALGVYSLAFVLTDTFRSQLMGVMNKVMYPVYGKKQDDKIALKKYYFNVVKYNSLVVYPIMAFLLVLGEPFILQVFGQEWHGTIAPLKILSVAVMLHMMVSSNTSLIRGLGRPGLEMKIQLIKGSLYIPIIAIGVYWYGAVGAAAAFLINKIYSVLIAQYMLKRLLNIPVKDLLLSIKEALIASFASMVIAYLLYYYLHINFIITGIFLFVIYVSIVWILMQKELTELLKGLRKQSEKTVAI